MVLAKLFVHALGPSLSWDAMTYHLTLPKIYLENRGFVDLPFNVYANWPSNVQLLCGFALAVQDYVLAKLVHWAFLVLLTVAVHRFAARAGAAWAGVVAASLLWPTTIVLVEAPIGDIDIAVAFFFFMAVALAIEFRSTAAPRSLIYPASSAAVSPAARLPVLGSIACVFPLVVAGSLAHHRDRRLSRSCPRHRSLCGARVRARLALADQELPLHGRSALPSSVEVLRRRPVERHAARTVLAMAELDRHGSCSRDYLLLPMRVILHGDGGYQNFGGWISKTWIVFLPLTIVFTPFVPPARRLLLPAGL